MKISFPRNIKRQKTQRSMWKDSVDYAAWCQDVNVNDAIKYYGRWLGARWIRTYYKAGGELYDN